jgi:pimeloyl-ACP methyl ester carboxylesterase
MFICGLMVTAGFSQVPKKSETVSLKGSDVYYEVYGEGPPLFLLHAYTQSSQAWLPFVPAYAHEYEVYLVDLRGHGRSGAFKGELSIKAAAEDVNELIRYLKLDSINAIGYSYGGDVLFQLSLLRPGLVKSMVIIGACGICDIRDFPHWIEYLSYQNIDNLPWMREMQPSEDRIKSILEQTPNYNVIVSEQEFKSITTRTMLVMGDQEDGIHWEDILKAKNNLPHSYLWVLPDSPHGAHKDKNMDEFIRVTKEFFGR